MIMLSLRMLSLFMQPMAKTKPEPEEHCMFMSSSRLTVCLLCPKPEPEPTASSTLPVALTPIAFPNPKSRAQLYTPLY